MLEVGADSSIADENRDTPRDAASRRGYRSVEALLDRGPLMESIRWQPTGCRERPETEAAAKAAGNQAFGLGTWSGARAAVGHYTDAILLRRHGDSAEDPVAEAVLLSNRSASHARLAQYQAALEDANEAVTLRPDWGKAHGRRGAALLGMGEAAHAVEAYKLGLSHDPSSAILQEGLETAARAAGHTPPVELS